jgi:SAM-dependent methyltransferase
MHYQERSCEKMQPYSSFAAVYDMFMDNVPYEEWADYVQMLLKKNQKEKGLILELGCGTGSMTRQLAAKGYDMIGLDNSEEMLQIAREKGTGSSDSILYLCQDMREFELFGTVAAVVSVCDSMNYILSEEDLKQVFRLVNNYLDPRGIFIFDLDTEYAYKEILGDNTIAENREEGSFIWENTYYEDEMLNEINLTLFIPEEQDKDSGNSEKFSRTEKAEQTLFHKYEETHYRKAYTLDTIRRLIEEAGLEWVAAYDMLSERKPKKDSERVYIIAREKRQKDKLYLEKE